MPSHQPAQAQLFILDFGTAQDPEDPLHRGRLIRASSDGTSFEPMLDNLYLPDSVDIMEDEARLYWTCMGTPGAQDGLVHSCLLDGTDLKHVTPTGLFEHAQATGARSGPWKDLSVRQGRFKNPPL